MEKKISLLLVLTFTIVLLLGFIVVREPQRLKGIKVEEEASEEAEKVEKEPTYIGAYLSEAEDEVLHCQSCHEDQFTSWQKTKHATTFLRLDAMKGENKNPECLRCHTTGYGAGGYEVGKTTPDFRGVQCEACHGPGSEYVQVMMEGEGGEKAISAGLIIPTIKVCVSCHTEEQSPNFSVKSYFREKSIHDIVYWK